MKYYYLFIICFCILIIILVVFLSVSPSQAGLTTAELEKQVLDLEQEVISVRDIRAKNCISDTGAVMPLKGITDPSKVIVEIQGKQYNLILKK